MKIGMLADTYKPRVSGVTRYIELNKKFLEQAGHEVYVFTFGEEDPKDDEPNIVRSPGLPLVDSGYYLSLGYEAHARRLLYTMDLVHVHHPFLSGSLALRYCRPRRIPIVFTNHSRYDLLTQAYLPSLPESLGEAAMRAYLPPFCRACDLVIAPSEGMRRVLQDYGVDAPIEVIPNGVDLELFRHPPKPIERAQLGFAAEHVLLTYVGRLGPEKNLVFLLRAFGGVVQAFEQARLLIVGDGPERDNLQDRVRLMGLEDKVHFSGMVDYESVPNYLAACDAFVISSVAEVHPLSVIEAMAVGLPVLGIVSPGVADTVEDGVTGFLSQEDLAAFTAKLCRLVADHEQRRKMGVQARQAAERYDIRYTVQLLLQHYQRLIERSRPVKRGFRFRLTRFLSRWK